MVVYQIKDTIFWKQITTAQHRYADQRWLFIRSKIQFFESKSQQLTCFYIDCIGCLSDQRYNFLKANHNTPKLHKSCKQVVYQIKDTIFWKQITTCLNLLKIWRWLFIRSKIHPYYFGIESYSQLHQQEVATPCRFPSTHPLSRLFLYLVIWNLLNP